MRWRPGGAREHCVTLPRRSIAFSIPGSRRSPPSCSTSRCPIRAACDLRPIAAAGAPPDRGLSADDDPAALALIERGAQDYSGQGENSRPAIARAVRGAIERGRLREEQHRRAGEAEAAGARAARVRRAR
jgi:hypothetical protein